VQAQAKRRRTSNIEHRTSNVEGKTFRCSAIVRPSMFDERRRRTSNIEHRTSNVEGKTFRRSAIVRRSMFNVRCSMFARPSLARRAIRGLTPPARLAFTLVEMLVVIIVVLAVTALAIGIAIPNVQQKRLREAARQVGAFVQGAKARAGETGRPVAVILEPDGGQPRMARTLKYAEVPPPYAGDTVASTAQITAPAPGASAPTGVVTVSDVGWQGILRAGDLIQFNSQGHYYRITGPADAQGYLSSNQWQIAPIDTVTVVRNPGGPLRYQVTRQPVASAGTALELPEGVVVDLSLSGPEGDVFPPAVPARPIVLVFSPGGAILQGWANGNTIPLSQPFYLMIGKREHVETSRQLGFNPPLSNLDDFETLWIAINHQTGLVNSVENAGGGNSGNFVNDLNASRDFARKAQTLGGR
jgi:type II secretory pathway pseudopilin PulG